MLLKQNKITDLGWEESVTHSSIFYFFLHVRAHTKHTCTHLYPLPSLRESIRLNIHPLPYTITSICIQYSYRSSKLEGLVI